MIEQQYYTKERVGLFSEADDYGTVAKSPRLKVDYIKDVLEPLCYYDIPTELKNRNETDERCYPPIMIVKPGVSGELIVGQSVYKAKDFTGQHSTFFVHNLILSENEKYRFIKDPEKIFGITGFKSGLEAGEGRQLPTLAGIDYESNNPYFMERERLFIKLNLGRETFFQLISAAFATVCTDKKILIKLNVAIEELGMMAKALLYHLYRALPWKITEQLGICTYTNHLKGKDDLHIIFLDKHTELEAEDIGKHFVFDFVHKKYPIVNEDLLSEPYIKKYTEYYMNRTAWERINHWGAVLSSTYKNKDECGISFYSRVLTLFEISLYLRPGKMYDLSDSKVRKGLLRQILMFLRSNILDNIRKELFDVMEYCIYMIQSEIEQGQLIPEEDLKMILAFKLDYCRSREQEAHCIQILLGTLTISSRHKNYAYIYEVLNMVHSYTQTYIRLFEAIYQRDELRKQVGYYLVNDSFKEINEFDELVEQMNCFEEVESILIKDPYYAQVIYEKFKKCLEGDKDLFGFLEKIQTWANSHKGELYQNILELGEYHFLEYIRLKKIEDEEMICSIKLSRSYPIDNYKVIEYYQKLRTDLSFMSPSKIQIHKRVQELVKIFFKKKVQREDFYMLVYAFLEMEETSNKLQLNLEDIMSYLEEISLQVLLEFIIWAKGQEMYIDKEGFDEQVVQYFVGVKQKEKKIDKELIIKTLSNQEKTVGLAGQISDALKPSLAKWLGLHRLLVSSVAVVMAIAIGSIGFYMINQGSKQEQSVYAEVESEQNMVSEGE